MKKVLFAAWHPGGANAIAPVIDFLRKEGKVEVKAIAHQYAEPVFTKHGVKYDLLETFLQDDVVGSAQMLFDFNKGRPDLVVTGTATQDQIYRNVLEQQLAVAAKRNGVPCLAVSDCWTEHAKRFSNIFTGEQFCYLPDRVTALDEIALKIMVKEGIPREIIEVTGNPFFDDLLKKAEQFTEEKKQQIRQQIGLPVETLVFFAGNAFSDEKDKYGYCDLDNLKIIVDALNSLPQEFRKNVGVAVKLHPRTVRQDADEINVILEQANILWHKIKFVPNVDSHDLILASDLVLTAFSTIAVEAVYMDRPCISMQPNLIGENSLIVSRLCIIPTGYAEETCRGLLSSAIASPWLRNEICEKASSFCTDGKATLRVAKLVYSMLGVN
jgi:CDP-glycerol glycerophosphotransferase (TagB/SpsB family)